MIHELEWRDEDDTGFVLLCSCGQRFESQVVSTAEAAFAAHIGIRNARAALEGAHAADS